MALKLFSFSLFLVLKSSLVFTVGIGQMVTNNAWKKNTFKFFLESGNKSLTVHFRIEPTATKTVWLCDPQVQ